MRLVDANTGQDMRVGQPVDNVMGTVVVTAIHGGLFTAVVAYRVDWGEPQMTIVPVRYLHPDFLFQRVAFFPS